MINDSVREELKDKISPIVKPLNLERKPLMPNRIEPPAAAMSAPMSAPMPAPMQSTPIPPAPSMLSRPVQTAVAPKPAMIEKPIEKPFERPAEKMVTSDISVKPTAPTLVEFHNKNATVPEWRLQLQNAVLQRQNRSTSITGFDQQPAPQAKLVTSGATALKPEPQPEPEPVFHANPKVNSALQRIEQSRRRFLVEEQTGIAVAEVAAPAPAKNYPFHIAAKAGEVMPAPLEAKPAKINQTVKPRAAAALKTEIKEFDTNKLPPLPVKLAPSLDIHSTTPDEEIEELKKTEIKLVAAEEAMSEELVEEEEVELEEIEDLAPFAMRFNAGLFDLIIGAFVSFILLTPFMIQSGGWFTVAGFLAFSMTVAVVMFIYMTTAIGLYGRTFGMRIFSLEVVDIEGENYPTVHQAAVSSCLYLLSLALGGIGFLTLPFNSEKRAVHDLVSGTIVVKEI
jgi:uncharacterized RDD family membrane protein YckC